MRAQAPILLSGLQGLGRPPFDLALPVGLLVNLRGGPGSGKSALLFGALHRESLRRLRSVDEARPLPPPGPWSWMALGGLPPTLALRLDADLKGRIGDHLGAIAILGAAIEQEGAGTCPDCGATCRAWTGASLAQTLIARAAGSRLTFTAPIVRASSGSLSPLLAEIRAAGFARVRLDGVAQRLDELPVIDARKPHDLDVIVDRLRVEAGQVARLVEAIETAWRAGKGRLRAEIDGGERIAAGTAPWCGDCDRLAPALDARQLYPRGAARCATCEGEGLDAQGALCPTCRGDGLPAQARAFGVAGQPLSAWLGRPITALEPLLAEAGATGRALGPAIEAAHQAGLADHGFGTPLRALGPGLALRLRLAALGARPLTGSALLIERPSAILPALALDDVAAQARRWIEAGGSVFVEDDHPRWRDLADTVVDLGGAPLPSVSPQAPALPRGRLLLDLRGLAGPGPAPRAVRIHSGEIVDLPGPLHRGPLGHARLALGLKSDPPWPAEAVTCAAERIFSLESPRRAGAATLAHLLEVWSPLRELLAATREARVRGWGPERFSLHRAGGRCEGCEGAGLITWPTPDGDGLRLACPDCGGRRFAAHSEEIRLHGLSAADLLQLTPARLAETFAGAPRIGRPAAIFARLCPSAPVLGSHLSTLSTAERDAAQIAALVGACRPIELPAALFFFDQPDRVADPAYTAALAALFAELAAGGAGVGVASAQGRAFGLRTESSL